MFGLPTEDDGTRTDALLGQSIISCTHYEPDRRPSRGVTRMILAAGVESKGQLANRGAFAVAEPLGTRALAIFPSDHGGFLGGEVRPAG